MRRRLTIWATPAYNRVETRVLQGQSTCLIGAETRMLQGRIPHAARSRSACSMAEARMLQGRDPHALMAESRMLQGRSPRPNDRSPGGVETKPSPCRPPHPVLGFPKPGSRWCRAASAVT
ncbi:hypothetical protein L6452_38523 [Arctium lappa]|uniref:Uncharacterized protein n=1 Tax=Arctium lappa TaxID=4217 RepID=A0ACB8XPB6_ARCLA|nr:hypothetical protein L6452_38523 [Arctium lappa]